MCRDHCPKNVRSKTLRNGLAANSVFLRDNTYCRRNRGGSDLERNALSRRIGFHLSPFPGISLLDAPACPSEDELAMMCSQVSNPPRGGGLRRGWHPRALSAGD